MSSAGHRKSLDLFARDSGGADFHKPRRPLSTAPMYESPASPDDTSDEDYSNDGGDTVDYCRHYLRTGTCAYTQQGCRSSHNVPQLDNFTLWRKLGFSNIPDWVRLMSSQDQTHNSPPRRLTKKGNPLPEPGKKFYCSFYLQKGHCAYERQGCKFSHQVPDQDDLELWQAIGFSKVPGWLRSRASESWDRRSAGQAIANDDDWTERQPPRGPHSQQMDISPPPLRRDSRRMDCYRPSKHDEFSRDTDFAPRSGLRTSDDCRNSSNDHPDRTSAGIARVMDNVGSRISTDRIDLKGAQSEELRMTQPYGISCKQTLHGIFVALGMDGEIKYLEEKEPRPFVVGVYLYDGSYEQHLGTGVSYSSRLLAEEAAAEVALRHPLFDATKFRKATSDEETSKKRRRNVSGDRAGPGVTDEYGRGASDHSVGQTPRNGKPMFLSALSDDQEDTFGINIRGLAPKALNADKPGSAQVQGGNQPPEVTVSAEVTRHKTPEVTNPPKAAGFNYLAALYPSEECMLAAGPRKTRTRSPYDGKRTSSTPLSDLTTSSRSSHLRKKCSYCKKPESNFQSLIPCTTCPRKYHNICGDPRPDKVANGSFVCGRCLEKQKARTLNIGTAPSEDVRLAASVPSYDVYTVHQSLQPRPQFDGLPGEASIVDILNAANPTELDSRNIGTDLGTSDMLPVHDHVLFAGQTDSIEPTKQPESFPVTPASISKPSEDYSPDPAHSAGQVKEATTRTLIGCDTDDGLVPDFYRPKLAAGGIVPMKGQGRSTDSIQALRATRIGASNLYDDSQEEVDLGPLPCNDDIGNVLDAPRAPKAMRGPAPNTRNDSNIGEHHDQSMFDDDKENMPVQAPRHRRSTGFATSHLTYNPLIIAAAQKMAVQYKNVTCPWWQAGDTCKRPENECMFSHRQTGIESPNGNNKAKNWTCPKWMSGEGCPWNPEQCLYAHADTSYYVGLDGKARKKHLTCYWFYHRGRCNKRSEACLFAHRWTGLLAEEPASKPARNSSRRHEGSDSFTVASGALPMPQATISTAHENGLYRPKQVQSLSQIETPDLTNLSESYSLGTVQDMTSTTKETHDKTAQTWTPETQHKPQSSADPRARGKNQTFVYPQQPVEGERMVESTKENFPLSVPSTTSTNATRRSQESARRSSAGGGVKKCISCGKKVIGRDVCVSCQKSSQGLGNESRSTATVRPTSSKGAQSESSELLVDIDVDIQETSGGMERKDVDHVPRDASKVLKRSASGSGLFAPNKRTRPNPPAVPRKTTRPNATPPSIEEVIAAERSKKEQHTTVKASGGGVPVPRKRTFISSDLASPGLALDHPVVSAPASAARSRKVSDTTICTEGLAGKQAMNKISPPTMGEIELTNSEVQQSPPIGLHGEEDDDSLEDIEYSVTESMAEEPRSKGILAKRSGDASSDEESEIPLLQRCKQHNEKKGTTSEQDKLWSSSTIASQGITAGQPVTVSAPKRLPSGRYNCPFTCGQTFSDAKGATRHAADLHVNAVNHQCEFCGKGYCRKDKYRAHIDSCSVRDATRSAQSRHTKTLVVEGEQTEPRKEVSAVSQSRQLTRRKPLHEEAANDTMPTTFAHILERVTRIEPEPEWEDRNDGDEETTSITIPSVSSPRAVKVEACVTDKTVTPSAGAAQAIDSDTDETSSEDSDNSEDQSKQVCQICPRSKTVGGCLHGVSGSLDGKKCDDYISERVARNVQRFPADTHVQLMAIEDAALESRRAWQIVGRAENLSKTKEDVTIMPEALKLFDLGLAMSMDCERSLMIHNHSSSHIMFKAQIHYGPCKQEWELCPNWGEIGWHSMLSVCARRKINNTPGSYQKLGLLPVQYPEYITVSYVPLTSDDDISRMEEWVMAKEHGVVPIKTIRVPIEYTRKSPLSNSAEGGSMIGEAIQDELNYEDMDDLDELTLSEVETPRPVKKIRLKPIVQVPPRKPAKKSQFQGAPKLTLKFPANTQPAPILPVQQQTRAPTTDADKSREPSVTRPRETQATVTSNKELSAASKASPVKKINLRVGPPPMGSPASRTPQTRVQHRRTASEANRIEDSPLKTLQAAAILSRAEESSGTIQQISVEGPEPLRKTLFDHMDDIFRQKDTHRPAEAMSHHAGGANSIVDRNNKSPQKARPRMSLRATGGSFERSLSDDAKKLTKAERKEPSTELHAAVARLKARGVKFEDPDTDDEVENDNNVPQLTKPQSSSSRTYPPHEPLQSFLFTHDKHSLYYKPENSLLPAPPEAPLPLPKITKGQGMKQPKLIRHRQMLRNLWLHGNAHKECNRHSPKQEVYAMVERKIPDPNDRYAPDVLQVREEKITFREFCGLKRDAEYEPCLIGSGEGAKLAFREKEDGKFGVGVGSGRRKRVADREKWPVSER